MRQDVISLEDLAALEAGGRNSPQYKGCLDAMAKAFPEGDIRLIGRAEPRMASLLANSDAVKYWQDKYPKHPAPPRIAEPTTAEGWRDLVASLKADNERLRGLAEDINSEALPVNATVDMKFCITTFKRYWTTASKDDNSTWNSAEHIIGWIVSTAGVTRSRASAIQQITRPDWASTGGRPRTET
ncbi:MAG: hypothetical protein Q8J65_02010 [Nitrosomonadales bacterium]|nr:hypothetical protein [Nitrosomonadales bacterium]